jgi:hypothetical protein
MINNIQYKKKLRHKFNSLFLKKWPIKENTINHDPHFIFLLTPPNSGSTAIARVFNTSKKVALLRENGEGQWLIRGLYEDRWNEKKAINQDSIISVWSHKYHKLKKFNPEVEFIFEKSPPNIVRIRDLCNIFPNNTLIANNRDPYANISSIFFGYQSEKQINNLNTHEREKKIHEITLEWIYRSKIIKEEVIKNNIPLITYEQFCNNPLMLNNLLSKIPEISSIALNYDSKIKVKKYGFRTITNFNEQQISNLEKRDISIISNTLKENHDILSFFKYKLFNQ